MRYIAAVKENILKQSIITVETDLDALRLIAALREAEACAKRDNTPLSFFQSLSAKGIHVLAYDEGKREYAAECGAPEEAA